MLESKKRSRVDFEYTHRVVWMKQEGKETLPWAIEQWCMINDLPLWGAACIYCCMDCEVIISSSVHVGVSIKELWKVSGIKPVRAGDQNRSSTDKFLESRPRIGSHIPSRCERELTNLRQFTIRPSSYTLSEEYLIVTYRKFWATSCFTGTSYPS